MEIGSELKQGKFRNNYHRLTVNLLFTYGWLSKQLDDFFKPYGITQQQFNILRILRGNVSPLNILQIRDRMVDRMSDITRIVERLIIKGLVSKRENNTDRRKIDVSITGKGIALLGRIDLLEQDIDNIVANISERQAENLSYLLDKIRGWNEEDTVM
jgi:MarR family 2-MHQ and catechol resistance regulon transcriptional repressor